MIHHRLPYPRVLQIAVQQHGGSALIGTDDCATQRPLRQRNRRPQIRFVSNPSLLLGTGTTTWADQTGRDANRTGRITDDHR
ncbi:hypothetical protein C1I93_15180 [Micromonospora endophytica]|uniref:Uncharacterized protein n=1 Tax=Micromonospora endophytica TaxID=515350 RepID=A0A2W2D4E5_9ACTN|nr:hypothetical protein C1I93_15180 [Micromonospora endophytica]RIW51407.1 hypothetical protein D3H59_00630 [Micromonospora endophytica]